MCYLFPKLKYKKLVITGNGFDLHHGLKTSYNSFRAWLAKHHLEDIFMLNNFLPNNKVDMLWSSFEEALGQFDINKVKNNDIQNLYVIEYYKDENNKRSVIPMVADSNIFQRIGLYFSEWARENNKQLQNVKSDLKFTEGTLFITFNYTDTLECVYNIPSSLVIHINGRATTDKTVIIGHNRLVNPSSVYDEKIDVRRANNQLEQLTNYSKLYKDGEKQVVKKLSRNIKEALTDIEEVIVLGHSYSKVDDNYFLALKKCLNNNAIWILSYHADIEIQNVERFVKKQMIRNYRTFKF